MATVAQQRLSHDATRSPSVSPANMPPAQHAASAPASAPVPAKKNKAKKAADPSEQQKQIQAKIAQLELDQAGDKEQELEIGGFPRVWPRRKHPCGTPPFDSSHGWLT